MICLLGCQLFFDSLEQLGDVEWLLEGSTRAEEIGDVQEVPIALRPGNGDDFGIDIFARQLECGFQSVGVRHEQIHDDEIRRVLLIGCKALSPVSGLKHRISSFFQHLAEQVSNRFFVVDD